jgi:hypothetical protein
VGTTSSVASPGSSSAVGLRNLAICTGAVLLAAFSCLLYLPVALRFLQIRSDYTNHIRFAEQLALTHHLVVPHVLFHFLIIGVVQLAGTTFDSAALIVLAFFYGLTGALLYREAAKVLIPDNPSRSTLAGGAAAALLLGAAMLLMQPILKPGGSHMYQIGYFWAEPYLSPTYSLMKPLALASAISTASFLTTGAASRVAIGEAALATVAGALAKPSFVICLVPAVLIVGALRSLNSQVIDRKAIFLGLFAPAAAVLILEYYISYSGLGPQVTYQNTIVFAPLEVLRSYAGHLAGKLALSVLFPASVYVLYWRNAQRDLRLNLGFLLFTFGIAYGYLFAEKENWRSANFLWSGYVTLFILFVFAVTFYVRELKTASWKGVNVIRHLLAMTVLVLHVHSGILTQLASLREKLG